MPGAEKMEWDRSKSQSSDLDLAARKTQESMLAMGAAVDSISDHDQAQLRARGIELQRRLRDFEDLIKKSRPSR